MIGMDHVELAYFIGVAAGVVGTLLVLLIFWED